MLGATGGAAAALALAACAPTAGGKPSPADDRSGSDKSLIWANWPLYLDEDDDSNYPTLQRFIDESGIQTEYNVDVNDNQEYFAKVKDQLRARAGTSAPTSSCSPTGWSAVSSASATPQELDHANIPNIANLQP